jgi:TolB-like protein
LEITPLEPSADEIRLQLDRLVTSGGFANADRMIAFLRYVVERALAGESDQVKEYVIGVAVFGRGEEYDPRLDSIVRVEARRLRTKLDEYYVADGRDDPVVIRMRRGSYAATFERRAASPPGPSTLAAIDQPARAVRWRPGLTAIIVGIVLAIPLGFTAWRTGVWTSVGRATPMVTVAVLPFAEYSSEAADALLAARLTDGVTSELARMRTVGVVSHTSAQQFAGTRRPLGEIAQALHAEMILEARVLKEGEGVRVEARLVDALKDRKVWVKDFVGTMSDLRDLERRIATAVGPAAEQARTR